MNCNKSGYIMIRPYSHDIIDIHSLFLLILSQGIILEKNEDNCLGLVYILGTL